MGESEQVASWAVYQVTILGQPGPNAVCFQGEWEAIERAQPGLHRLVRGGITNEGEAERLARGDSGGGRRAPRKKAILALLAAEPARVETDGEGIAAEDGEGGPVVLPFSVPSQGISEIAAPDERVESA